MPAPTNNFNISQNLQVYGNLTVTGDTIIQSLSATSFSASTYQGNVVSQITAGSGISINQSTGNVTITATGGGGGISGSGTTNYLPKWTGTTALGNSQIRDDGTSIGVGIAPSASYKMYVYSITNPNTLYVQNQYSNGTGIYVYANGSNSQTGIRSSAWGDSGTENIGVVGEAVDGNTAIGVKGAVSPSEFGSVTTGIGGYFDGIGNGAYGYPSNSYSVQLIDGTEGTNKVLISKTSDGKANWSSSLTGLTSVSATTYYNLPVSGLTQGSNITITNNGSGNYTISSTGGGGTPGGNTGEVQFNNAGSFSGAPNVEISEGNLKLVSTSDPSTPTGGIISYSKVVGGRHLPKIIGPSGIDTIMQVGLHGNSVMMCGPANGTAAPTTWGGVLTTTATISHQQTIASANPWQATRRTRFQTSTAAGNATGMRTAYTQWFRGSATGFGGFWFRAQLGMNINLNGGQKFVGLCASTAVLGGDPSALVNMCGMGYNSTDLSTGNWQFMYNDGTGTATKVDLGVNASRSTLHGYDLVMYMAPGGSELFVRIVNLATNVTVLETSYTTDIPTANVGMALKAEVRNGAVAAADNLEIAKVYIETDF